MTELRHPDTLLAVWSGHEPRWSPLRGLSRLAWDNPTIWRRISRALDAALHDGDLCDIDTVSCVYGGAAYLCEHDGEHRDPHAVDLAEGICKLWAGALMWQREPDRGPQ